MSKKITFIWLTFVFILFQLLAVYSFRNSNPYLLIASEVLVPLLYIVTITMSFRSFTSINRIGNSLNLIHEGEFNNTLAKTGINEVDKIILVYNSMISRLREERLSVREKNQFLDLLIESSPLGIIIMDLDDHVNHINKAGSRYLGLYTNDYKGKPLCALNNSIATELEKITYDKKQIIVPDSRQKYLCRKLYFMDHGFKHPFYIVEELTEEIRNAEKEAYGKLIRMMAHEVNNTIGSVNSIMSTFQSYPDSIIEPEREDTLRMLGIAIQRNYQLNRFMQNLSGVVKLPVPDKAPMDLNESLYVVIGSFSAIFKERKIKVSTSFQRIPVISADRSQMEQVFTNITKNSIEAIDNNGEIAVSTTSNPVCISFKDNGNGLTSEASEKIFTPFFSTKPDGQGIGLTLVNEILTNHGFTFSLKNRKEGGAEFIIGC
ncbi:MAG TPA: ATP-binding protein [Bacteroidales bacterium]|nr:ATP-binding protein [Bacteroidales bacterium]